MREFLTLDELILIHFKLIDEFGGSHGLRDLGALESALMRPQIGHYKDIIEESAAFMESLAINHPFIDGNKRIAFFATDVFLRLNDHCIECDNNEAYSYFMKLFESNSFRFDNLLKWLKEKVKLL